MSREDNMHPEMDTCVWGGQFRPGEDNLDLKRTTCAQERQLVLGRSTCAWGEQLCSGRAICAQQV